MSRQTLLFALLFLVALARWYADRKKVPAVSK